MPPCAEALRPATASGSPPWPAGRVHGRADVHSARQNVGRDAAAADVARRHGEGAAYGSAAQHMDADLIVLDTLARTFGADAGASVLQAVVRAAEQGDMAAARIVLDRAWPVRRGRPVRLELPAMRTGADLAAALGDLGPAEEGAAVAAVLEAQRRAIETQELERRIAILEAAKESGA